MLMVYERPPGELTPHTKKILEALRSAGDWLNRAQVAEALGKSRLTPYDVRMLDELAAAGTIEAVRRDKPGFIPFEWFYRALPEPPVEDK